MFIQLRNLILKFVSEASSSGGECGSGLPVVPVTDSRQVLSSNVDNILVIGDKTEYKPRFTVLVIEDFH